MENGRCRWMVAAIAAIGVAGFVYGHAATSARAAGEETLSRAEIKPFINASGAINHASTSWVMETMSNGVCVGDFNSDNWDDLFFPSDNAPDAPSEFFAAFQDHDNKLYINRGDKDGDGIPEFEEVSTVAGVTGKGTKGIGCTVGDYNNDGRADLYITAGQRGFGFQGHGGIRLEGGERVEMLPTDVFVSERTDGFYECEGANILYRNDGNDAAGVPSFTDVTDEAGVAECRQGSSAAFADIDLDGDLDLMVGNFVESEWWFFNEENFNGTRDTLFENNGDGTFTDITEQAGVGGRKMVSYRWEGQKIAAFNPDIKDSKGRTVGEDHSTTHVVGFLDYDGDRFPDLISVSDAPGVISIFHNNGDNTFTDVTEASATDIAGDWMGIAFADVDGDGDLDMFNSNFGSDWFTKKKASDTYMIADAGEFNRWGKGSPANKLWRFDGVREIEIDGRKVPVPIIADLSRSLSIEWGEVPPATLDPDLILRDESYSPMGLEHTEFGFGSIFFDFDNDTHQDLYFVGSIIRGCGDTKCQPPPGGERFNQRGPGRLLQNLGKEGMYWREVTFDTQTFNIDKEDYQTGERVAWDYHEQGRGVAKGDFNNDGYVDFVVSNLGGPDSNLADTPTLPNGMKEFRPGPSFLYINPGYDNHWLKVKLEGNKSNRDGIGALVRVTLPSGRVLVEQVTSGTSYLSNHSFTLMFGLGKASRVSKLEVSWPSGEVDSFTNVRINRIVKVTEGGKLERVNVGGTSPKGSSMMR